MIELIKELILDAQSGTFFTGTPRRTKLATVQNKASVIRRTLLASHLIFYE
jgi:hypothetical protein